MPEKMRVSSSGYASIDDDSMGGSGMTEWLTSTVLGNAVCQDEETAAGGGAVGGIVATANTIYYMINGETYTLTAASTIWDLRGVTTFDGNTTSRTQLYLLLLADSAGACTSCAMRGTEGNEDAAVVPTIPDGCCCIGYLDMVLSTTRDAYNFDQGFLSHGTFHQGYPRTAMYVDSPA